jgi:hypothetical protein
MKHICHVFNTPDTYVRVETQPVSLCGVLIPKETRFATSTTWAKANGYRYQLFQDAGLEGAECADCPACWALLCVNCDQWLHDHAGDKCLFMESSFAPTKA